MDDIHQKLENIEDLLRRALYGTKKIMYTTDLGILQNNLKDMHEAIQEALQYQQYLEDTLHELEYDEENK